MKTIQLYLIIFFTSFIFTQKINSAEIDIYKKIDLFGEVLEKINKEYVEEINQSESMDSAINGLLQSLDPYSAYMSPEIFEEMQTETSGEFGGLGIEVSMEAGVVKVISPIDDTPASKAGIKAGDYIVKIEDTQVQGKTLSEAVDLMRGPVGSSIDLKDKSSMADYMIIASGTSSRHIQSLSEQVLEKLKVNGIKNSKIEGKESNEWKLVDGIDLIIHIFHPEKRKFYELEKIWSELIPKEKVSI